MIVVDQGRTAAEADVPVRETENAPPLDPRAIETSYRLHRARRRARVERHREKRRAGLRFWIVVVILVTAILAIGVVVVDEVQRLFGV